MDPRSGTDPGAPEPRLAVGYYLANFEAILDAVDARYHDLLDPSELSFIEQFARLSLPARRLYTRLLSRKGPYFRGDRLGYVEIPDIEGALGELGGRRFLTIPNESPIEELLSLLLKAELAELLGAATEARRASRSALFEKVLEDRDASALRESLIEQFGLVELARRDEVLVFRLLFFGNLGQDWKEFVLRDTGVVRYESYPLAPVCDRRFGSRVEIEDAITLRLTRSTVSQLFREREFEKICELGREVIVDPARWHAGCLPHFERIVYRTGRAYERLGNRHQALEVFRHGSSSPNRRRQLRLLELTGRHPETLELCREMETESRDELEIAAARSTAARLGVPRSRGSTIPRRSLELVRDPAVPVEQQVLNQLTEGGNLRGFFAENWLWCSLFGLAFWDIIFSPIRGVFQHEFQYGPLDLHQPNFRSARSQLVDDRLAEIRKLGRGVKLRNQLMTTYRRKQGIANRLVSWSSDLVPCIETALGLLDGTRLAAVCDRMSRDLGRYRRGFPDLFITRATEPGFELLEVKAPGDQLRPEQKAWLRYLDEQDLPSSVVRVLWKENTSAPPRHDSPPSRRGSIT